MIFNASSRQVLRQVSADLDRYVTAGHRYLCIGFHTSYLWPIKRTHKINVIMTFHLWPVKQTNNSEISTVYLPAIEEQWWNFATSNPPAILLEFDGINILWSLYTTLWTEDIIFEIIHYLEELLHRGIYDRHDCFVLTDSTVTAEWITRSTCFLYALKLA